MKKKRTDEGEGVCYYAKSEYQGQCQREPAGQLGDCHSSPAAQLDAVISGHRGHGDREADHHGDVGNWGGADLFEIILPRTGGNWRLVPAFSELCQHLLCRILVHDLHLPVVAALCHPRHRQGAGLFPGLLYPV